MKVFIVFILSLILNPRVVLAENNTQETTIPVLKEGVVVLPYQSMSTSQAEREKLLKRLQEMKSVGYVEMKSDYAQFLFLLPKRSAAEKMDYKYADKDDTHLKGNVAQIKLAFPYKGISFINNKDVIGYGAIGNWDPVRMGWTGVVEFFNDSNLGICALNIFNTKLSHGMNQVAKEVARYDINSMPDILSVEGTLKTGFLYHITFYQKDYWKALECANKIYDPKKTEQLVELAKKLDKDHGALL